MYACMQAPSSMAGQRDGGSVNEDFLMKKIFIVFFIFLLKNTCQTDEGAQLVQTFMVGS